MAKMAVGSEAKNALVRILVLNNEKVLKAGENVVYVSFLTFLYARLMSLCGTVEE